MSAFGIDVYNFEEWRGPPPTVPTSKVVTHHRPGTTAMTQQVVGTWGDSFEVTLKSHWASFLAAMAGYRLMSLLPGTGAVPIKYGDVNWTNYYGVAYHVESVDIVDMQTNVLLHGPGYSYASGCVLTTRFVLVPQRLY